MKKAALLTALLVASGPIWAQSEGAELAKLGFESSDLNGDGVVSREEMFEQGDNIFVSMDYNDDGALSFEEFTDWDFGFQPIAEELGREQALETALKIVFNLWDRNYDGAVTLEEQHAGVARDFVRNDLNGDFALSPNEFLGGFVINIAIRSALKVE